MTRVCKVCLIFLVAVTCSIAHGQLSVNPYGEPTGLTVQVVHDVKVKATRLRLYAKLEQTADDPKQAVLKLAELRKSTTTKLFNAGAAAASVKFTPTKLREWEQKSNAAWQVLSDVALQIPDLNSLQCTAYTTMRAEWEIKESDAESLLLPIDITERLRKHQVFSDDERHAEDFTTEIFLVFVGYIKDTEPNIAIKTASEEAKANAQITANLAGHELGELKSLVPQIEGAAKNQFMALDNFATSLAWGAPTPIAEFPLDPMEVLASDPSKLIRRYKIEMRYDLK